MFGRVIALIALAFLGAGCGEDAPCVGSECRIDRGDGGANTDGSSGGEDSGSETGMDDTGSSDTGDEDSGSEEDGGSPDSGSADMGTSPDPDDCRMLPCEGELLCNPMTGECEEPAAPADRDGDGTADAMDCAPDDPAVYPGATEACDGVDQDCDSSVDEGSCGDCGRVTLAESTYLVCRSPKTWHEALADCEGRGYSLATIDTRAEDDFLNRGSGEPSDWLWIGLSDHVREDRFVWADGSGAGYRNWDRGTNQPDDWETGEDCVHNNHYGNGWNDFPCSSALGYLCER